MSLLMYSDADCTTLLGDNDLKLAHNGFTGGAEYMELYIQNSEVGTHSYADIDIDLEIDHTISGYTYKTYVGDEVLSEQEWDDISRNTPGSISTLSGATVHKVTFRVYLAAGSEAQCFYSGQLKVKLTATQTDLL